MTNMTGEGKILLSFRPPVQGLKGPACGGPVCGRLNQRLIPAFR